jgi:hypothetical protein
MLVMVQRAGGWCKPVPSLSELTLAAVQMKRISRSLDPISAFASPRMLIKKSNFTAETTF